MGALIKEKEGKRYGDWTILRFNGIDSHHDARWLCRCELCGGIYSVRGFALRNGKSTHCKPCAIRRFKAHNS